MPTIQRYFRGVRAASQGGGFVSSVPANPYSVRSSGGGAITAPARATADLGRTMTNIGMGALTILDKQEYDAAINAYEIAQYQAVNNYESRILNNPDIDSYSEIKREEFENLSKIQKDVTRKSWPAQQRTQQMMDVLNERWESNLTNDIDTRRKVNVKAQYELDLFNIAQQAETTNNPEQFDVLNKLLDKTYIRASESGMFPQAQLDLSRQKTLARITQRKTEFQQQQAVETIVNEAVVNGLSETQVRKDTSIPLEIRDKAADALREVRTADEAQKAIAREQLEIQREKDRDAISKMTEVLDPATPGAIDNSSLDETEQARKQDIFKKAISVRTAEQDKDNYSRRIEEIKKVENPKERDRLIDKLQMDINRNPNLTENQQKALVDYAEGKRADKDYVNNHLFDNLSDEATKVYLGYTDREEFERKVDDAFYAGEFPDTKRGELKAKMDNPLTPAQAKAIQKFKNDTKAILLKEYSSDLFIDEAGNLQLDLASLLKGGKDTEAAQRKIWFVQQYENDITNWVLTHDGNVGKQFRQYAEEAKMRWWNTSEEEIEAELKGVQAAIEGQPTADELKDKARATDDMDERSRIYEQGVKLGYWQ